MSQHDLVLTWNHAEDMVHVSPLTANICITHHGSAWLGINLESCRGHGTC